MGFYFAFNSPTHTSGPDSRSSLGVGVVSHKYDKRYGGFVRLLRTICVF